MIRKLDEIEENLRDYLSAYTQPLPRQKSLKFEPGNGLLAADELRPE